MARCPDCKRPFRVMEDEEGMHECPYCGASPADGKLTTCEVCGERRRCASVSGYDLTPTGRGLERREVSMMVCRECDSER